jgi:hypothetical protein
MADPIEELRATAAAVPHAPGAMAAYLAKVRDRAYAVTDADVAGLDEDVVFEQTVAVAIREGLRRLDRAREVLG